MADTKQTKTIGEHFVAAEMARRGWAPAFTRDGLERTDILAVKPAAVRRPMVEVQVKTARVHGTNGANWPLGLKSQLPAESDREFFVLVVVSHELVEAPRYFVVPRNHVSAAAWIAHMDWLTDPSVPHGKRNAPVSASRVGEWVFSDYRDAWELLEAPNAESDIRLPSRYRELAADKRVGLPESHPWNNQLPSW